jgi:hypothetical protein
MQITQNQPLPKETVVLNRMAVFSGCENLQDVYFKGNAPRLGATVGFPKLFAEPFHGSERVIVYYSTGTTGWGSSYGYRPTAQWKH